MYIAVAFLAAWSLVLTIAFVALLRHLADVNLLSIAGGQEFHVDNDGPDVDSVLPEALISGLGLGSNGGSALVTFMSASCGPCLETAKGLSELAELPIDAIFLVTARPGEGSEVLALLAETGRRVITDPAARQLAQAANIHSTPFAFYAREGRVTRKAYLRSVGDFVQLAADATTELRETVKLP